MWCADDSPESCRDASPLRPKREDSRYKLVQLRRSVDWNSDSNFVRFLRQKQFRLGMEIGAADHSLYFDHGEMSGGGDKINFWLIRIGSLDTPKYEMKMIRR